MLLFRPLIGYIRSSDRPFLIAALMYCFVNRRTRRPTILGWLMLVIIGFFFINVLSQYVVLARHSQAINPKFKALMVSEDTNELETIEHVKENKLQQSEKIHDHHDEEK